MTRPISYSVARYGDFVAPGSFVDAYTAALRAAIRSGCTVLEVGAGTGFFSLFSCWLGAGHVHALEVARASAAANGFAERISFHPGRSTGLSLDPPADVIVSDLRGVLPLLQHHIASIADARRRRLAPGGVLIPARDHLYAALVHDPKLYARHAEPWTRNGFGLDLRAGHVYVVNNWRRTEAEADQLLVPAQRWATLDYYTIEEPNVAGRVAWTVERAATAHGLLLWFDAELMDGIGFSNAPGEPPLVYGQGYFPLEEAVELLPGDRVEVRIRADLVEGEYV